MNTTNILQKFEPVGLDAVDDTLFLNRYDTKYLLSPRILPVILDKLSGKYRVLDIDNRCFQEYESLYFDNREFRFYLDHQNGKSNRYKVRFRKYPDSKTIFIEVKFKNNKDQTRKWREQITPSQYIDKVLTERDNRLIDTLFIRNPGRLFPRFCVTYSRLALIHKENNERVTIDLNLSYKKEGEIIEFDSISIAELKQGTRSQRSDFFDVMRKLHIVPARFSKYCFGIYQFFPGLKHNRFKSRFMFVDKKLNGRN